MEDFRVLDIDDRVITVGCKVDYDDGRVGIVTHISEPDADYDDNLQRGVMYAPVVVVGFTVEECLRLYTLDFYQVEKYMPHAQYERIESFDVTKLTWADYPDGPQVYNFQVDDLKVLN